MVVRDKYVIVASLEPGLPTGHFRVKAYENGELFKDTVNQSGDTPRVFFDKFSDLQRDEDPDCDFELIDRTVQ